MKALFRRLLSADASRTEPSQRGLSALPNRLGVSEEREGYPMRLSPRPRLRHWPFMLATAMVSATVLLLEMTFTRLFSLFLNYHYVFVVLAVALLGLGGGATLCGATRHRWLRPSSHPPERTLWQVCLGTGLILIMVTTLLTQTALASRLLSAAALALLPFLGCGLFLALVFTGKVMHSRELYAADLFGAGMGCLVSLLVLQGLGLENTLALSALGLLAVAVFLALTTDRRRWPIPVCISLCVGGLLGFKMMLGSLTIGPVAVMHSDKHLGHILRQAPHARMVDSRWSALARTDVVELPRQGGHQYAAFTDGGAATSLIALPTTRAEWAQFEGDGGLFPYRTSPRERVLIIGSGGGLDVLLALHGGARAITAVEVNPDILHAVERFIPPTRNVYRQPTVQVIRGDGRQAVRRSRQVYDLIVLPQVYTGAAPQRGGALVENYVLTVEAFQDYLRHLTPQGRLVVQVHDLAEIVKTVWMGVEALTRSGIPRSEALHHFLILQGSPSTPANSRPIRAPLVMVKTTPYSPAESRWQASLAQIMPITPLFIPYITAVSPLGWLLQSATESPPQSRALSATWRPATDNRPFFYETDAALTSLSWISMAVLLMLLGLQLGPYLRPRSIDATVPRATTWLPFFAATGCAALLAQVALLQRYQLVLGSPTLTLVALLFPLLFFGGVSSLASTRLSDDALRRVLPWSCLALGALLVLHLAVFSVVRDLIESQSLLARVLSIMILLAPLGMLTGLPFPVALRRLSPLAETIVPWAWGVNTVACVLGSVAAVRLAVSFGLQTVVLMAALVYGLAGWWACRLVRKEWEVGC